MKDPEVQATADRARRVAYKVALGMTRDPELAEDIAQDVAITALTHAKNLNNPAALNAWLYRTATNASIDAIRRRDRQRATDSRYADDRTLHREHDELDPGLQEVVELLAVLPERQRATMLLRYVFDVPDREIARALDCKPATVRVWVNRASATLRAEAGKRKPEGPTR